MPAQHCDVIEVQFSLMYIGTVHCKAYSIDPLDLRALVQAVCSNSKISPLAEVLLLLSLFMTKNHQANLKILNPLKFALILGVRK